MEGSLDGDPSVSNYKGSPEHICYKLQPGSGEHLSDGVAHFWDSSLCFNQEGNFYHLMTISCPL